MTQQTSFEELIKSDRAATTMDQWRGSFLDYLEKVKEDPSLPKLAHARIYDLIMSAGVRDLPESESQPMPIDGATKIYDFFAHEFFGIEKVISQIVRYFHSAALKGEEKNTAAATKRCRSLRRRFPSDTVSVSVWCHRSTQTIRTPRS